MYRRVPIISMICTLCIISLTLCACDERPSHLVNPHEVVASVNDVSISRSEIESRINALKQEHAADDEGTWEELLAKQDLTPQTVRQRVLERLITEILVMQDAQKHNITIDDSYVDEQIKLLKTNYPTEQAWRDALAANGYDDASYRHAVELNLLTQKVQRDLIDREDLSDAQLIKYIKAQGDAFECRRCSHILFNRGDKDQAERVLAKIKAGASFEICARRYSQDAATKNDGGDLGWDYEAHFADELQETLNTLDVGDVSGLVESKRGYHIIKCTDRYPLMRDDEHFKQIPEDLHTLIHQSLTQKLAAYQFEVYLESLRARADIKIFDADLKAAGVDSLRPNHYSDESLTTKENAGVAATEQSPATQSVQPSQQDAIGNSQNPAEVDLYNNPDELSDQALDLMIQDLKSAT